MDKYPVPVENSRLNGLNVLECRHNLQENDVIQVSYLTNNIWENLHYTLCSMQSNVKQEILRKMFRFEIINMISLNGAVLACTKNITHSL